MSSAVQLKVTDLLCAIPQGEHPKPELSKVALQAHPVTQRDLKKHLKEDRVRGGVRCASGLWKLPITMNRSLVAGCTSVHNQSL